MSVTTVENPAGSPGEDPLGTAIESPRAAKAAAKAEQRKADQGWVFQVTSLSIILGILLALAVSTTANLRQRGLSRKSGVSAAVLGTYKEQLERQRQTNEELTAKLNTFQAAARDDSQQLKAVKKELAEVKRKAGLAPVEGPGLRITMRDSTTTPLPDIPPEEYMIHDHDLNGVLNELKAAGVEALAISGADPDNLQRVIATTSARCVGPTAVVNNTSLSAPYHILAIGNPKELRAALEMPNGIIKSRSLDTLKMIEIQEESHLVLPAYSGGISSQYARAPKTASE